MTDINAAEMLARLKNGDDLNLLDVREKIEFHTYNIGGINIPLPDLERRIATLEWDKTDEIIVVCRAGIRSQTTQSILGLNGYQHIRNLSGGLMALQKIQ
jgi:adenylyltransferase/sulfurtransferase